MEWRREAVIDFLHGSSRAAQEENEMKTDLLAPISRLVVAPAWALWERTPYLKHYRRLLQTQFDSPETIRQRQFAKARELIVHAYRTVPFWKAKLDEAGFLPHTFRSLEDLRRVPPLTKNDLRTRHTEMVSEEFHGEFLHRRRTSGSTGVPVEVLVDEATNQFVRACTLRSDEWSGWRLGERMAAIWGNAEVEYRGRNWRGYLRNLLLHRAIYLDSLSLDATSIERFADSLRRHPATLLFGHAHSLYLFAQYCESVGRYDIRPRAIISAAMVLHDWERETIERAFKCPVTNRYGCEEVGLIASECEFHSGMHVNSDGIFLEAVRSDGSPADIGEEGMLLVTDLTNRAMPLIRYQIGDMGILGERRCSCGRGLPILEKVEGRVADYVLTSRGQMVSGISLTDHFNTLVPGVAQMQIIQESIDHFLFRIVRGDNFNGASQEKILRLAKDHFGDDIRCEYEFVEQIPQESSGKYRFCISKVPKPFA